MTNSPTPGNNTSNPHLVYPAYLVPVAPYIQSGPANYLGHPVQHTQAQLIPYPFIGMRGAPAHTDTKLNASQYYYIPVIPPHYLVPVADTTIGDRHPNGDTGDKKTAKTKQSETKQSETKQPKTKQPETNETKQPETNETKQPERKKPESKKPKTKIIRVTSAVDALKKHLETITNRCTDQEKDMKAAAEARKKGTYYQSRYV